MFLFKILRRIFTAIVLLVIIVPLYVAGHIWWTAHHPQITASDAIVILGAAQDNGTPTPILAERIKQAELIYREHLAPLIITVGGGQKGDMFTEAQASRNTLVADHISRNHVVELPVGKDTLTSTVAYVSYMKLHHLTKVIISTDSYHCYRAMAEARNLGLTVSCTSPAEGPGSLKATGIRYIFRETGAYLAYETVGRFGIHLSDQIKK